MIKKVLLFMPPAITSKKAIDINPAPPLGLGYIAAVLEQIGIKVKIVDCLLEGWDNRVAVGGDNIKIGLNPEEIEQIIWEFRPDVVSVNNQFTRQYQQAHDIYRIAKLVDPKTITIAGGAHPSVLPRMVLQDKNVDFVVIGEGETTIKNLVEDINTGIRELFTVEGIGYRVAGGAFIQPKRRYIENLDVIPSPAWHLMNVEKYMALDMCHGKRKNGKFFSIYTSRGCPAKCTFCTAHCVWGFKYRGRSAENVMQEIRELRQKYGVQEILIEDDNFTFDIVRAERICDMLIQENLGIKFDTPNGIAAYKLTNELLLNMKQAGFAHVNFAIESGNQRVVKEVIKKPLDLGKVKGLIRYCHEIGLEVGAFFIIGMPGTTLSEMWDNYRFCKEMKLFEPFISIATPYPGSELYDICVKNNYLDKDFKLEDLYIRTNSITTEEWGAFKVNLLARCGYYYLKFYQLLDDPVDFMKKFKSYMMGLLFKEG